MKLLGTEMPHLPRPRLCRSSCRDRAGLGSLGLVGMGQRWSLREQSGLVCGSDREEPGPEDQPKGCFLMQIL